MLREGSAARSGLITIVIVASLGALACGDSNPASPTDTTTATTTTTTTTTLYTPKVTGVEPASGADAGGTVVTITGEHFTSSATVKIGGASATSVTYKDETTLLVTTPAGTAGAADIVVTVGYLSGTLAGGFTYLAPVDAALTFTVYNHTAGRLGSWTATLQSGATVSLAVGSLGEVVDADGNTVQAAIPVDSADSQRLVVRKAASDGRVGDFVAASTSGTVTFQVPIASRVCVRRVCHERAERDRLQPGRRRCPGFCPEPRHFARRRPGRRDRPGWRHREYGAGAVGGSHLPLDGVRTRVRVSPPTGRSSSSTPSRTPARAPPIPARPACST